MIASISSGVGRYGGALGWVTDGREGLITGNSSQRSEEDGASMTSIMRDVKIDRDDPLTLHEQVAAELRRAVAEGEALPGERLPPARDLAAVLGVNTNTVLRAMRTLRDEGLLDFRRGRGVTVAGDRRSGEVTVRARDLVRFARSQGYHVDELIDLIKRA